MRTSQLHQIKFYTTYHNQFRHFAEIAVLFQAKTNDKAPQYEQLGTWERLVPLQMIREGCDLCVSLN